MSKQNIIMMCKGCNTWINVYYDQGYPDTRYEPGEPAGWFTYDDPTLLEGKDDFGEDVYCYHDIETNDDFMQRAHLIDAQSFEMHSVEQIYYVDYH